MRRLLNPKTLILGLIICGILAAGALLMFRREAPSVRLSDGSTIRLEFARVERPESGRRKLPGIDFLRHTLSRLLSVPSFSRMGVAPNALVFWISRKDANGNYMDFSWWEGAKTVDDHGCEFDAVQLQVHANGWSGSGRPLPAAPVGSKYVMASAVFPAFPRREKTLKLRFYDRKFALVTEIEIPNPAFQSYPDWKPERLPATRSAGDLQVTLASVTNHWTVVQREGLQIERYSLTPHFQFTRDGAPTTNWTMTSSQIEDATGNHLISSFRRLRIAGRISGRTHGRHAFHRTEDFFLCTNEPAWKLTASLLRTPEARFSSNEMWTIPNLEVPAPGIARTLAESNTVQELTVQLCAIAGPGNITYSNGVPIKTAISTIGKMGSSISASGRNIAGVSVSEITAHLSFPHLILKVDGESDDLRLDCIALAGGSVYPAIQQAASGDYRLFRLDLPDGIASVDLRVIAHRSRAVEFLISPPIPIEGPDSGIEASERSRFIPPRPPGTPPQQIDLSQHYNLAFSERLIDAGGPTQSGSAGRPYIRSKLPVIDPGPDGIAFDVRGMIQLNGLALRHGRNYFQKQALDIPIGRTCTRIHFLHGSVWSMPDGTEIGQYRIHYADGDVAVRPIVYGEDVRDYYLTQNETPQVAIAQIAWPSGKIEPGTVPAAVLYRIGWENPRPDQPVQSIDFVSAGTSAGPFLLAITTEP